MRILLRKLITVLRRTGRRYVKVRCPQCGWEKYVEVPVKLFDTVVKLLEPQKQYEQDEVLVLEVPCERCQARNDVKTYVDEVTEVKVRKLQSDRRYIRTIKYRRIHGIPQI